MVRISLFIKCENREFRGGGCGNAAVLFFHDHGQEDLVGNAVILNDYETFAEKVYHTVLAL